MMLSLVCSRRMMLLSDGGDVSEDRKKMASADVE